MRKLLLPALLGALSLTALAAASVRSPSWDKVRSAIALGLPKTALQTMDPIIRSAVAERADAEAIRAITLKIALESGIQGNRPEEKIRRMHAAIDRAPARLRPVLEAILADWYWQYFQRNRWRFMQRTRTAEAPGADFTTWDLPRLFAEIDLHFTRALAGAPRLQRTPIAEYAVLFVGGNAPDAYRPTLFDAVAFGALDFYASGEQAGARPEDTFVLDAESAAFAPADTFERWAVATTDTTSPIVKGLRLYQALLHFHAGDADPTARIDADLWRLEFVRAQASGARKDTLYAQALEELASRHADHELSARALHALALLRFGQGDRVAAHRIAGQGLDRFPESIGGRRCFNLIGQIEQPELRVRSTENVWNATPDPLLEVEYRNLTQVYFRLVPFEFEREIAKTSDYGGAPADQDLERVLERTPALAWSAALPPTSDYRSRTERLGAPHDLPSGYYVLIASGREDFRFTDNVVTSCVVWISDLALVLRGGSSDGCEGFVLEASNGAPVAGARVRTWRWRLSPGSGREPGPSATTNTQGMFRIEDTQRISDVLVEAGDQRLGESRGLPSGLRRELHRSRQTLFFTDRSIYRPGQTIHYKGLCLDIDQRRDHYTVVPACSVRVVFHDANDDEIAAADHVTNGYGSFSGTFTAPGNVLLGEMSIDVEEGPDGYASLRVEEYKRPRFQATLESPRVAPRLDDSVHVAGVATAYNGAPVDGATVEWRVRRQVRYPEWWGWWFGWRTPRAQGAQEIAHGRATSDASGRFTLAFVARPDPAVSPAEEPVFDYAVTADVTDLTGETRSASRSVRIGYTALAASVSAPEWLEAGRRIDLAVRTTSLDGAGQGASGTLTIVRLLESASVSRAHVAPPPTVAGGGAAAISTLPAVDPAQPQTWPEGRIAFRRELSTDTTGAATTGVSLPAGMYRARFETRDRFGRAVTAMRPLRVLAPAAWGCPTAITDLFAVRDAQVVPGGEFLAVWGSGAKAANAYVEVECAGRMLQAFWSRPGQTQVAIRQRVDASMRGGFTVRVTRVYENRAYLHEQFVNVPWTDRTLEVRWEHFVSKLHPGARETWTAVVTGPRAQRVAAEMVATLYDASLDAFAPHEWMRRLSGFRTNHDGRGARCRLGPVALATQRGSWPREWRDPSLDYRAIPGGLLWGDHTFGISDLDGYGTPQPVRVPRPGPAPSRSVGRGPGKLVGTVLDGSGRPVAHANVMLLGSKLGTATGEQGRYALTGLPVGSQQLRVVALGYSMVIVDVNVLASGTTALDIQLGRATSVKQFQEIEVGAEKRIDTRSSSARQSISADMLWQIPVDNLREAVALKSANVATLDDLHFRGGRADEVVFDLLEGEYGNALAAARLADVVARKDLRETAFFFPHLIANRKGEVRIEFTVPEGLTEWRFIGFAHDAALRSGTLEARAVTSKDLMVTPNPPRFLREGDELEFTVKVTNRTDAPQRGLVRLTFTGVEDSTLADAALGVHETDQTFELPARESRTHAWRVQVPDDLGPLRYRAVASTAALSDGEEGLVPVVSRSVLVIESLPLPIRGAATKTFDFERLRRSGESRTLRSRTLTVQMVSNPAWYAVMALPYLIEFPHECTEQTFNRLYANALAGHIAGSDPRIRRVFDAWRDTPALDSPLEQNADLKSLTLLETPWLRQGREESQAHRNVGILFDSTRASRETARLTERLAQLQLPDGAWPWFPGGKANDYITLYITTGFGRLRHLGVDVPVDPAIRSLDRLDGWSDQIYRELLRHGRGDQNNLSPLIALYLYGRSFYLDDRPVLPAYREAVDYWLAQARRYWLPLRNRQSQGHLALALARFGDLTTARAILRSVREYAVSDPELGTFWRDTEESWWWYRAPIETQALMIEAFDEVMADSATVEGCRVWLLKQKQTQDWKTTKATADAVYALLLRGTGVLASEALVEVTLGDTRVQPASIEAGTGFYSQRFTGAAIRPAMGRVTVRKTDAGVAWGSVHWQYLEDMDQLTSYAGTPLRLAKAVFVRRTGKAGPELHALAGAVHVGDELVVRVELRTDRDMEYVHLKDYRGSGVEPVNVLSGYRFQDGLGYYEETRDVASHFFIDYLAKGTYVFEYPVRVQHRGRYSSGVAEIQCMYAPEFNSHSASVPLVVE